MEPILITKSALTILEGTIKAGTATYSTVKGIRKAPVHIGYLTTELEGLCTVLATLQALLDKNIARNDVIIRDMLENLQKVLHNCTGVFIDIQTIVSPFVKINGQINVSIWKGFKWAAFKKDDVTVLHQTLNSYKSMLNMSLAALSVLYSAQASDAVGKIEEQLDSRLKKIQQAVKRLKRTFESKERVEKLTERDSQEQHMSKSKSNQTTDTDKRLSIASYNASLRLSLQEFDSIISRSSSSSRTTSTIITAEDGKKCDTLATIPEDSLNCMHSVSVSKKQNDLHAKSIPQVSVTGTRSYDSFKSSTTTKLIKTEPRDPLKDSSKTKNIDQSPTQKTSSKNNHILDHGDKTSKYIRERANRLLGENYIDSPIIQIAYIPGFKSQSPPPTPSTPQKPIYLPLSLPKNPTTNPLNPLSQIKNWLGLDLCTFGPLILHTTTISVRKTPSPSPSPSSSPPAPSTLPSQKTPPQKKKTYHVYLFTNIILFCRDAEPPKALGSSEDDDKFKPKPVPLPNSRAFVIRGYFYLKAVVLPIEDCVRGGGGSDVVGVAGGGGGGVGDGGEGERDGEEKGLVLKAMMKDRWDTRVGSVEMWFGNGEVREMWRGELLRLKGEIDGEAKLISC